MKRLYVIILCLLALLAISANADPISYNAYGDNLVVNADATMPQMPVFEHKYMAKVFWASDAAITSEYNVEPAGVTEIDDIQLIQHAFSGDGIDIYSSNDGNYFYQTENFMTYYTLLYYCTDVYDNFHPDWMLSNTDELDFMTAEDAGKLIDNTMKAIFADVSASFDIKYDVYPAHAEDMRNKVASILEEECHSEDDIAFYKRKYGLYEGCIVDGGDCYFIEGRVQLDGLSMLTDSYSLSNISVYGIKIRAIVTRDGILCFKVSNALSISGKEPTSPVQLNCEELLTNAGNFLDNIIGLTPLTVDKIELVYVPYPVALREYELVPMLCLSSYDSEKDTYVQQLLINVFTGELFF